MKDGTWLGQISLNGESNDVELGGEPTLTRTNSVVLEPYPQNCLRPLMIHFNGFNGPDLSSQLLSLVWRRLQVVTRPVLRVTVWAVNPKH